MIKTIIEYNKKGLDICFIGYNEKIRGAGGLLVVRITKGFY